MTTLSPSGFLTVGASHLEYRMIGPSPESAPTIVIRMIIRNDSA